MTFGSLAEFLMGLADEERAVKSSELLRLSGLGTDERPDLRRGWETIGTERRREVISRLVELAEDSVEADFHSVFSYCLEDPDPVVRELAVSGLWETDDRVVISLFIARLEQDSDEAVRAAAAMALGRFATLAECGELLDRDGHRVNQALLWCLRNGKESMEVRRRALEAAGAFNSEEVRGLVSRAYESDAPAMRQSAVFAMGRSADSRWLPVIFHEMGSADPAMRYEAANACREMGEEEAVPHLAALAHDPDQQVQLSAIQALGGIGGAEARKVLRRYVRSPDDSIREAAEEALRVMDIVDAPLRFKPIR